VQFFNKAKEDGFTAKEMEMLRRLAIQSGSGEVSSIFLYQDWLDMCIRLLVNDARASGREDDPEIQTTLSRLYDCRQKIEIDRHESKNAISNTHQIKNGQVFKIFLAGMGAFTSQIVKNANGYMTISRPVSTEDVTVKEWRGMKISICFWREDDAGYMFTTEVKDEVYSLGILSLKISHNLSLSRVQKRKSIRVKMNVPAFLYLVGEGEAFHKIEASPGLKCILEDISASGCAVTVGGKAADDLHVKIQFELNGAAVCVSGTVRSAIYWEDTNRSVLHVEADPMPPEIKNKIFNKVLGSLESGDDDDTSFRILDDAAIDTPYNNLMSDQVVVDSLFDGDTWDSDVT